MHSCALECPCQSLAICCIGMSSTACIGLHWLSFALSCKQPYALACIGFNLTSSVWHVASHSMAVTSSMACTHEGACLGIDFMHYAEGVKQHNPSQGNCISSNGIVLLSPKLPPALHFAMQSVPGPLELADCSNALQTHKCSSGLHQYRLMQCKLLDCMVRDWC